jgi:hypothetical protein
VMGVQELNVERAREAKRRQRLQQAQRDGQRREWEACLVLQARLKAEFLEREARRRSS